MTSVKRRIVQAAQDAAKEAERRLSDTDPSTRLHGVWRAAFDRAAEASQEAADAADNDLVKIADEAAEHLRPPDLDRQ